jgi:hypothetical protein
MLRRNQRVTSRVGEGRDEHGRRLPRQYGLSNSDGFAALWWTVGQCQDLTHAPQQTARLIDHLVRGDEQLQRIIKIDFLS